MGKLERYPFQLKHVGSPSTSGIEPLENIRLKRNWIKTIEKLINAFELAGKIGNLEKFKKATKANMENNFHKWWESKIKNTDASRLIFYKTIKCTFKKEDYLDNENFEERRKISKLRCSDHRLEVEINIFIC